MAAKSKDSEKPAKPRVGSKVLLHTHNPINARLDNEGKITRVLTNGRYFVEVDLNDGRTQSLIAVEGVVYDFTPWFEVV